MLAPSFLVPPHNENFSIGMPGMFRDRNDLRVNSHQVLNFRMSTSDFSNDRSTRQTKRWFQMEEHSWDFSTSCRSSKGLQSSNASGIHASGWQGDLDASQNCSHRRRSVITDGSLTLGHQRLSTLSSNDTLVKRCRSLLSSMSSKVGG